VIMKYAIKHNLTMDALTDLLQLVKLHCPSPNNIPSTLFLFKKHFQELQYPVIYHDYCNSCLMEISDNSEVCSNQECCTVNKSVSSFIELPVRLQLPDKTTVLCRAILLCTTCDLPARAMILNMTNFNGFYSCCFCLQPGKLLSFSKM